MTLFKYINASMLLLVAGIFMNAPRSLGYTNPIEGGVTETVTNTWVVPSGDLYVGHETPNNSLIISNGEVRNTHGFIGSHAGSNSNSVLVVRGLGGGSGWHNTQSLYLGGHREGTNWVDGGSGNRLDMSFVWVVVGEMDPNIDYTRFTGIVVGDASGTSEMVIANGSYVDSPNDSYIGYGTNESGTVEVRGRDSVWDTTTSASGFRELFIGNHGSNNRLTISDGGLVLFDSAYLGREKGSDNNMVLVTGEGSLWDGMDVYVGNYGSGNRLTVADGGRVYTLDGLIGVTKGSDNNTVLVTGTGSELSAGSLWVGRWGAGNALIVSDGGEVYSSRAFVSSYLGADSNAVFVTGLGSVWTNAKALRLGDGGRGNGLYVDDGGLVSVGESMHSRNYSTVAIDDPESQIVIGESYFQDATSILRLGIATNRADAPLQVGGTAEFEAGATLQYHGAQAGMLDFDRSYTNLLVEADQLIVGGITNAHDLGALEVVNLDSSLVEMALWEQDQDMYGLLSRKHLAESAGFVPGSQMALLSGEIDDLSVLGNTEAVDQINRLNRMSGTQQDAQLTQRYAQGSPNYWHNQTLIGGRNQVLSQSRQFQSSVRSQPATPSGPAGPHKEGQELRGWIRGYGSWADYEGTPSFSGFDHNVYGTIIGFDQAFGNVLLGAAGGYARSDLTQDNEDSSDATTGYGVLYASLGTTDWFGDLSISYGQSDIETQSGTLLGGSGNFTADHVAFYMGGGKEIRFSGSNGVAFTPEAALMAGYYGQSAYSDGLMQVDEYDRWSYQSRIGAALSMEKNLGSIILTPEIRTYWLHEFNADPDQVGYSLIGGTGRYSFGVQAPVEDLLEIGLGLSIAFNDRFELVLDVDSQCSELYKAIHASGRISYEF